MNTDFALLFLVADMSRRPELRERFSSDPLPVLDEYGVDIDVRLVLRSRDLDQVASELASQARAALAELQAPEHVMIPWFDKQPVVASVEPAEAPVGVETRFRVRGSYFASDARLTFARPDASVAAADVRVETGPDGHSVLTGSASFSGSGVYDVSVENPGRPPEEGTLPGGFTALAG